MFKFANLASILFFSALTGNHFQPLTDSGLPEEVQNIIHDYIADEFEEFGSVKLTQFWEYLEVSKFQQINSKQLAIMCRRKILCFRDIESGESVGLGAGPFADFRSWCILPWKPRFLALGKYLQDRESKIYIVDLNGAFYPSSDLGSHRDTVSVIIPFTPRFLISGSWDNTIKIWDISTDTCIKTFNHGLPVTSLLVLSDNTLASGSMHGCIKIWDIDSGKCLQTLKGHTNQINCMLALPKNKLVSGSVDHKIIIWDLEDGQSLRTIEGHESDIESIQALTSNLIIALSDDGDAKIWDINSGDLVKTLHFAFHIKDIIYTQKGELIIGLKNGELLKFLNIAQAIRKNIQIDRSAITWVNSKDKKIEKSSKCVIC